MVEKYPSDRFGEIYWLLMSFLSSRLSKETHMSKMDRSWCLVLVIWGEKYSDKFVDVLVKSVKQYSKGCTHVVLITDQIRNDLSDNIVQKLIPDFFNQPLFFKGGYVVKLSLFHKTVLPPNMPCVYIDLDTIVVGDAGRIAALVSSHDDYFMLPPGNLVGFGSIRRWLYKQTKGKRFATGNSSIVAFHSSAAPNICEAFEQLYTEGLTHDRKMRIDDVFISWFAQNTLQKIPASLAVMFRREFLSRSRFLLEVKRLSPFTAMRRKNLVAVTFNGAQHKPEEFLAFKDGDKILDEKNRFGFWSEKYLGVLKAQTLQVAKFIV